jgi:O-antigen/teichoic acid export membrane protein
MSSLKKSALSGMFWTFIQQFSTQGITFVVSVILARILLPEEFGLIALLSVFIGVGNVLVNGGLSQSLIRSPEVDDDDYSTVFFFNIIISALAYFIIFFSAPYIAEFYNQPQLKEIARVYTLTFVISSLSVVQFTRLNRDMDFKKQTIITIPSLVISGTLGIILALNNFGVWSLVWSAIAKETAHTIQLWWWSPWMPKLRFKKEKIKQHFGFGYKLTIAGVINTLFQDIYTIIIGKFFDPMQVGFYNRANTLRMLPVKNFGAVLNKVTFPLFSKIQDDDERLKNAYKKVMQMSVFLVAPTLMFMGVLAEPLFRFLLTEKWLPAVPYFQILCVAGIFYPINAYNLNVLAVKGRSDLILKLSLIKRIIIIAVILIVFQWGIYGLIYGQVFLSILLLYVNSYYCHKLINYSFGNQIKHIIPTIVMSIFVTLLVYGIDYFMQAKNYLDIVRIVLGGCSGIITFVLLAHTFKLESYLELKAIILKK